MGKWLGFFGLIILLCPLPASAHPHVFIDTVTGFVVEGGKVTALRMQWAFDEFFSTTLLQDFDKNHNKRFEPGEIRDLEREAFAMTGQQSWFTYVKVDGVVIKGLKPKEFTAKVIDKGKVVYSFLLPLPKPIDPKTVRLMVTSYENTYYIDVTPAKPEPAAFEGDGSLACKGVALEDKSITFYADVHPLAVALECPHP